MFSSVLVYPPVVFKNSLVFAVSSTIVFKTLIVVAFEIKFPQALKSVKELYTAELSIETDVKLLQLSNVPLEIYFSIL